MNTNILVIEDNVIALDELEYRLSQMGYNVATAVNYTEAVEKAKGFGPDIILSDINLGEGRDGIDTVNEIQKQQPVPVIYLTAYDDNETLKRAQFTEPYAYIIKPVKERELRIAVDIAINKNKTEKELHELNSVKNILFSVLGHDLSSPFASIYGLSKVLKERIEEFSMDELKRYIDLIYESSYQGVNLTHNLINWSHSQLNGVVANKSTINLFYFMEQTLQKHEEVFEKKNISVFNLIDTNHEVIMDENIMELVVRNLLSNAAKFTPNNGKINIISDDDPENHQVVVSIIDNGIGMSQEQVQKLFILEHKSSLPGTNNEKGNGLGLILCKEFIEKHGDKIWVESKKDKGSTFSFTLQRAKKNNYFEGLSVKY